MSKVSLQMDWMHLYQILHHCNLEIVITMNLMLTLFTSRPSAVSTHPFKEEEDEGRHHGVVRAVVQSLRVLLVVVPVVSPSSPGSEDHDGAPDEHHEVHDGHHSAGHLVDGKADLLPAVNLAVPLGAPLVDLSPGVDG